MSFSDGIPLDLTTPEGLLTHLGRTAGEASTVQCLGGGTANYLYRVADGKGGHTVVFKHAAPYLSSNKEFAFDQVRMDYEANILLKMSQLEDKTTASFTRAVQSLNYDAAIKLLQLEDGGSRNLKIAYDDPQLDIAAIGKDLAKWLSTLHLHSTDFSLALSPQSGKGNNQIAVRIYRHSYRNLHAALSQYGYDVALAERVNNDFGSLLEADDECVCHGDFWPGNVLVRPRSGSAGEDGKAPIQLTIIDWEMSRRGNSATDVGQFAAEAYLLDRFRGNRGLRQNFLSCYISERQGAAVAPQIDSEWIRRVAIHWAVHIAFWPTRVEWTDREGTKQLVDIGVNVLNSAVDGDWEALRASPLFENLGSEWHKVFADH